MSHDNEKKHLPPQGMEEPPNFSKIPKEFIIAYQYAFMKCKEANPGKPVNIVSFHAMLEKWQAGREEQVKQLFEKGELHKEGDNLVWGT